MTKPLTSEEMRLVLDLEARAEFLRDRAENLRALVMINAGAGVDVGRFGIRQQYEKKACDMETEAFDLLLEARKLRRRQDAWRRACLAEDARSAARESVRQGGTGPVEGAEPWAADLDLADDVHDGLSPADRDHWVAAWKAALAEGVEKEGEDQ